MKQLRPALALCATAALACAGTADADDGGISFGGSPHLLSGHSSISMAKEVVRMSIGKDLVRVNCRFQFHNAGPSCTVRMGFPDEGLGAEEPYQGEPVPKHFHGTFKSYNSWVNGKKVPTKIVATNDRSLYWHTKTVHFNANSDSTIVDEYTLKPGAQVTCENGLYQQTSYVLHTGASWHGPIGKADIYVTFSRDAQPQPIILKSVKTLACRLNELKWSKLPVGTVIYDGLSEPQLSGATLHCQRSSFRPTTADDIHLYYAYRKLTNMDEPGAK
jgi:hypothetical protein